MARETTLICDCCGKPTESIVGKLMFVPSIPGISRTAHSNYTHSADVGACCQNKLMRGINFRKRMTFEQYQATRRGERVA
jgi:hypothetical protein